MKKLFALTLALLLTLAVVPTLAEGQLRVGMECNYAPFNWTQADDVNDAVAISGGGGFAGGYDVEIAKRVAKALDKELVIVKIEWNGLINALMSDMIDVVIAGMSPTEERKLTVDFSDHYYNSDLVVIVRKDGAFTGAKTLADFAGARVTAQMNTVHYTVLDQLAGAVILPAMDDFSTMFVALTTGAIDGYVSERPSAVSACAANTDVAFITFEQGFDASTDETAVAIAVKKGREDFIAQLNAALSEIPEAERNTLMDNAVLSQPVQAQ